MIKVGTRARKQPPPPHVIFEALTQPNRDPARPWLDLLDDEVPPQISTLEQEVRWTSLWTKRPDAVIVFQVSPSSDGGTALRWSLLVDEPRPEDALLGHMRKRINVLINANLRYTFGQ